MGLPRAPMPFTHALSELKLKHAAVRKHLATVIAEQITYEPDGMPPTKTKIEESNEETLAGAMRWLNGSAEGKVPTSKKKRSYSEVIKERAELERADSIASLLGEQLRIKARGERTEAQLAEFNDLMRQKVTNAIAGEHIYQAIDRCIQGTHLENYGLPTGRLAVAGSPLQQFLEQAVRFGWGLKPADYESEVKRSREADPNR